MKKYSVSVMETYRLDVNLWAKSEADATDKAWKKYNKMWDEEKQEELDIETEEEVEKI